LVHFSTCIFEKNRQKQCQNRCVAGICLSKLPFFQKTLRFCLQITFLCKAAATNAILPKAAGNIRQFVYCLSLNNMLL